MIIDLTRLVQNFTDKIEINEIINFDGTYIKNTDIRKLDNVKVVGTIIKGESNIYYLNLLVTGIMILPCAITLDDVPYQFSSEISEILSDTDENDEKYLKINGNSIDILPIVWQNIVLEVPIRVVSETAYKVNRAGDGWKLVTEEEVIEQTVDPRLEKLTDLLND